MTAIATATVSPTAAPASLTPEDLLGMDGLFELSYGRLLQKRMGAEANWTAGEITFWLKLHLRDTAAAGDVLPEQSFQCFPNDPAAVRRPDVAFVAAGRLPSPLPTGHVRARPDLAIEVTSPNDEVDELELKLVDYRAAAIPLIWVVIPAVRTVRVYRLGESAAVELRPGDTLDGGPVLPGFAVAVGDLFRPAAVPPTNG